MTHVVALSAGLRPGSATRRLAGVLLDACTRHAAHDPVTTSVVEVAPVAHDAVDRLMTGAPSAALDRALEELASADALVVVTPTYNGSLSGLLKVVLDVADRTRLRHTPAVVAATGGSLRHTAVPDLVVRPTLTALRLHVAPTAVFAGPSDWQPDGSPSAVLADRADGAAAELLALVRARRTPPVTARR